MLATFPVRMIGPMVPSAYLDGRMKDDKTYGANLWKPAGEECLQWLSTKPARSVIYASFGSMADLKPKQIEELAWGLRDSGHHFLWVVKERQQPMLPGGYTEAVAEVGLVVSWCNQLQVLAHSAVGCFVTHCGWNSTMEGLCLGVPMVGMPQWADQTCNVKMVEEIWGVGLKASVGEEGVVGREKVVRCVREVMDGGRSEELRRNAGNWRKLAIEAVGEGGSSDKNIDEFVKELVHRKLV